MTGLAPLVGLFVACALGVPVPEDVALFSAGLLVSDGGLPAHVVFPVAWSAVAVGDSLPFLLGWLVGPRVFERTFMQRLAPPERRERIERHLRRWGPLTCFGARFVPGARTAVFAAAGAAGVRPLAFLPLDAAAAAISVTAWLFVGGRIGRHLPAPLVRSAPPVVLGAALAVAAALACRGLLRRRRRRADAGPAGDVQPRPG